MRTNFEFLFIHVLVINDFYLQNIKMRQGKGDTLFAYTFVNSIKTMNLRIFNTQFSNFPYEFLNRIFSLHPVLNKKKFEMQTDLKFVMQKIIITNQCCKY